ncbi:MAG: hypothetical protein ACOWWR_15330 [Eubacteriales bacterium]
MKIFDRRFLQYQLAALKHNKYKNIVLYPNIIILITAIFFRENIPILLGCILAAAAFIGFGHYRFHKEANASDPRFDEVMQKKYVEFEKAAMKKGMQIGVPLQKILFAVELDKMNVDDAMDEIQNLIKLKPEAKRLTNHILFSLYAFKYKDKSKIPQEYLDYLDRTQKNESNINILVDCMKTCIFIEDYNRAISLGNKGEKELAKVKKIRKPAFNAIYRTNIIALPYYQGLAFKNIGNKKKAKIYFQQALKYCKAKKLQMVIADASEI